MLAAFLPLIPYSKYIKSRKKKRKTTLFYRLIQKSHIRLAEAVRLISVIKTTGASQSSIQNLYIKMVTFSLFRKNNDKRLWILTWNFHKSKGWFETVRFESNWRYILPQHDHQGSIYSHVLKRVITLLSYISLQIFYIFQITSNRLHQSFFPAFFRLVYHLYRHIRVPLL
jgi:hypothetical protein